MRFFPQNEEITHMKNPTQNPNLASTQDPNLVWVGGIP